MEQLAENAQFGSAGDPRVSNLRRGTPQLITPAPATRTRRCVDSDEEDDEARCSPATEEAPRVERRQCDCCQIAYTDAPGVCCMCGDPHAQVGCITCGLRFCSGTHSFPPFHCMNRHLKGEKPEHPPRKKVSWWEPED